MAIKQQPKQSIVSESFKLKPLSACIRMAMAGGVFFGAVSPGYAHEPLPANDVVTSIDAGGSVATHYFDASHHEVTNVNNATSLEVDINKSEHTILNWGSFNVNAGDKVTFKEADSSAIVLNNIDQKDASQILGTISSNGQVYLVNANGFIFGEHSTVDTNTLVASALGISNDVINNGGIVNQFNNNQGAAFSGGASNTAAITIDKGANISVGQNGRLIVAAPTVTNNGNLTANNYGQIILVASKDKVYLQPASSNSPFSGLLVEVGTGGKVSNMGNILAHQGNITLAGFAVNQSGKATATTSVNVNGSIRLLAREGQGSIGGQLTATNTTRSADLGDKLGTQANVVFTKDSVTQVIAEQSTDTAIDAQTQPMSYLEVSGYGIDVQTGSKVLATSGDINMVATDNLVRPEQGTNGRLLVESGATVDASGSKNIQASVQRNVVSLSVQSYELRDSPYQKGGVLQGQTVQVDIRNPTSIIDISGALSRIQRGIDERLGAGGTVNMTGSGSVVINKNATVDISGGIINYSGGNINTTKLVTDTGQIVDISNANPNQHYQSIYKDSSGYYQNGYQQGLNAGTLNITTANALMNGNLQAGVVNSSYQRTAATMATAGTLAIDLLTFNSAQNVDFQSTANTNTIGLNDKFPVNKNNTPVDLVLSNQLINGSGLQNLTIKTQGNATLAASADLKLAANGHFDLVADNINDLGSVYSAGGVVRFGGGYDISAAGSQPFASTASINMGSSAKIDVSGQWVNDYGSTDVPNHNLAINAGKVTLSSAGNVTLASGSQIHADAGAWLATNQQLTEGSAGAINLSALANGSTPSTLAVNNSDLTAYGLNKGGSLSLSSGNIVVGNATAAEQAISGTMVLGVTNGNFNIPSIKSFSNISLAGNFGDLLVKNGTSLVLNQQNLLLQYNNQQATANSVLPFSQIVSLANNLRSPVNLNLSALNNVIMESGSSILADTQAAISLSANLGSVYVDGIINAPAGSISLSNNNDPANGYNPNQVVWLGKDGQLLANGTTKLNPLDASGRRTGQVLDGGNVSLTANRGYLVLESGSKIDVSGTQTTLDIATAQSSLASVATKIGSNAGKVSLAATEGAIVDGKLSGQAGSATTNGGQFSLALNRSLRNPDPLIASQFPYNPLTINVVQTGSTLLPNKARFGSNLDALGLNGNATIASDKLTTGGFADVRLSVINLNTDSERQALGNLSTDKTYSQAATVNFEGNVNLTAKSRIAIDAPTISWTGLNKASQGVVNLNTAFFRAGSSVVRATNQTPVLGGGVFNVNSNWTELGGESLWNGFSTLNFNTAHDLRTVGVLLPDNTQDNVNNSNYTGQLLTAANINFTASQLYPTTLTQFNIAIENNPKGQITIASSGQKDSSPLSAGGMLTIQAPVINQNGVVRAPLGTINLIASDALTLGANSLTSVSAAGQLIPFGVNFSGLDWLFPIQTNNNLVVTAPPQKNLVLSAPSLVMAKGSTIDVSGGGDLYSYQFQPGIGGSSDYLAYGSASYNGGFAILPSLGSSIAPYDPLTSNHFNYAAGSQVYLSGTSTLAAGFYTILPAQYALLPGAYLVTPLSNTQDQTVTTENIAGVPIVAGYQANSAIGTQDARWSGFMIESGAVVRMHSQYNEQTANNFYAESAALNNQTIIPYLPIDSGQISIVNVQNKLTLQGDIKVASPGGRGARMDIAATRLEVVNSLSATPPTGTLQILADQLTGLHVDSLLLGGQRSTDTKTGATDLTITSDQIIFDKNVHVQGTDIIVAASKQIDVNSGAVLTASGSVNTGDTQYHIVGDGALLRLSADKQVTLNRTSITGTSGVLDIAAGATLQASQSMLLDASEATTLAGNIQFQGGAANVPTSLNLSANSINLGDFTSNNTPSNTLNLSNSKLLTLNANELILSSRNTINIGVLGQQDKTSGKWDPLVFKNLVIDAAGLAGFASAGQVASLQANKLTLENSQGVAASTVGNGNGQLNIAADNYTQGAGDFNFTGFNSANFKITNGFTVTGNGSLNFNSDVDLTTGYLSAATGSKLTINDAGHQLQMNGNGSVAVPAVASYGGAINATANNIIFNARALLPSGQLKFHSLTGDVSVGSNAQIVLAGGKVAFADTFDYTSGGTLSMTADQGKITLASGSSVNLNSGGGNASAGTLNLSAKQQSVALLGQINNIGGNATIDVANFSANGGFDNLVTSLSSAGISNEVTIRARQDNIVESSKTSLLAKNITLIADQGNIDIAGKLSADNSTGGGAVSLYSGSKVSLENGAIISAKGSNSHANGGHVLLSAINPTDKNAIEIKQGSTIAVNGGAKGVGGQVILRALRTSSANNGIDDGIAISPVAGNVQGFSQFIAEGVRQYTNTDFSVAGQINSTDISNIKTNTDSYMTTTTMDSVAKLATGLQLRAGIEINYSGDLVLQDNWDLSGWRYASNVNQAGLPGDLAINVSGNFTLNNSLSDGFTTQFVGNLGQKDVLQTNDSWSYQLTAGADLSSADKGMLINDNKSLTIGANTVVRTGTGNIVLAASGDVVFQESLIDPTNPSTGYSIGRVYVAGKADAARPYGVLPSTFVDYTFYGEYPIAGGNLAINAGQNIVGSLDQSPLINNWLVRNNQSLDSGLIPSAWAVDFINFNQNVGVFGGGNANITAGNNVNDLAVMMPTTGKQIGDGVATNVVQIDGGGNLQVNAANNIAGGVYFVSQGSGTLNAGAAITGSSQPDSSLTNLQGLINGPQLLMGNTQLYLNANNDISITAVTDPMILSYNDVNFFSYSANSALSLKSLSGNIHLGSDTSIITSTFQASTEQLTLSQMYPGSLYATAFGGSILVNSGNTDISLFPSVTGNLSLLASQNIGTAQLGIQRIGMSDFDPSLLPSYLLPASANDLTSQGNDIIDKLNVFSNVGTVNHAQTPIHRGDKVPVRIVSKNGDITSIVFNLPKQAIISSGNDISNVSVNIQHANLTGDVSIISAARDIRYDVQRDPDFGTLLTNTNQMQISGPGDVLVKSGRNINFGTSEGLSTVGNTINSYLPSGGANVSLLVGLNGGKPDYLGLLNSDNVKYVDNFNTFLQDVRDFMRNKTGNPTLNTVDAYLAFQKLSPQDIVSIQPQLNSLLSATYASAIAQMKTEIVQFVRQYENNSGLSEAQALSLFAQMNPDQYLSIQSQLNTLADNILFKELNQTGSESASNPSLGYERGYAAIAALYPGNSWKGNLDMYFSKLQTLAGGDINLLVPGGSINAGLAVVSNDLHKASSDLGIVAQSSGNINAFLNNDFIVNQSRVFTLGGGNITLWSSYGNIDAGKGAKSAISAPPPTISFDANGNLVVTFPPVVSGSGIRSATPIGTNIAAGNVALFAPNGSVNAGEAGIGGSSVTIGAAAVLNAANINVGPGGSSGFSTSTATVSVGLSGTNSFNASNQMAQDASEMAKDNESARKNFKKRVLRVNFIDYEGKVKS